MGFYILILYLAAFLLYIALSYIFYKKIIKYRRKIVRIIYITAVIMIPTWDVVVGNLSYLILSDAWSKFFISEKMSADSIYYEYYKNMVIKDKKGKIYPSNVWYLKKYSKFKFLESKAEYVYDMKNKNIAELDKCYICLYSIMSQNDKYFTTECEEELSAKSRYGVIVSKFKCGTSFFFKKNIIDRRSDNKIIAQSRWVFKSKNVIPFFSWLWDWEAGSFYHGSLPEDDSMFFELQVISPN